MIEIEIERQKRIEKKVSNIIGAYDSRDMLQKTNVISRLESLTKMVIKTITSEVNYQMQKIKHHGS